MAHAGEQEAKPLAVASTGGCEMNRRTRRIKGPPTLRGASFRWQAEDALADLGESLMRIRDQHLYRVAGFETFADYCRDGDGFLAKVPPVWELDPEQVGELVAAALEVAEKRRRRARRRR
jgi:hypothetical protein